MAGLSFLEFVVGEGAGVLIESFALPANASSRIGLIHSAETLGKFKAWA
jgi:hypothetical protein